MTRRAVRGTSVLAAALLALALGAPGGRPGEGPAARTAAQRPGPPPPAPAARGGRPPPRRRPCGAAAAAPSPPQDGPAAPPAQRTRDLMAIKNVGVIGCGLMGSGIVQGAAQAGFQGLVG